MRHRIHTAGPFIAGADITIAGDEFHHAVRVARVREGEPVELFDGTGSLATGTVTAIGGNTVAVRIDRLLGTRESPLAIHLAMSIINLEKFELVLQKATELGVRTIIPMVCERIEIRPERYRGKADRWAKIVHEAVKQSGRSVFPRLEAPAEFDEVIARDGVRIVFDADHEPDQVPSSLDSVTVLVGPEGGFTQDEVRRSIDHGCLIQRLGPRRLRAETAAITATAVLAARYGDI